MFLFYLLYIAYIASAIVLPLRGFLNKIERSGYTQMTISGSVATF